MKMSSFELKILPKGISDLVENHTYLKTIYRRIVLYLKSGWNILDSLSIIVFLGAFTLHSIYGAYDFLLSPFISDAEAISDACPLILRIVFMKSPAKVPEYLFKMSFFIVNHDSSAMKS